MPRSKKNIELEHSNIEYINSDGKKASADFRHLDAKEHFLESQEDNSEGASGSDTVVRVYRKSKLGKRLLARFRGTTAVADAETFADQSNEVYGVRNFYTAVVE